MALASAALLAAPAVSAAEGEQRTTGVEYSDLDLTSEAGRKELDRRIDEAAREVCGVDEIRVGTRLPSREARDCYRDAKRQLDRHVAQLVQQEARGG
ncbi:UrcA family protein [Alteraurantiacibacter aquimixticola]|uniref:UrcA family protein n=2 Tax=Alteraurantiacibacter aquimixticola TaxID=2489173 RepID=A0A4T3EZI8_9SPHN|nr:UrcA family protein [Alteraurantiacibacter aquimixticola]